jgi:hypothetical protein
MNAHKAFTALFTTILLLGCISATPARERKERSYIRHSVGFPPELKHHGTQIQPYLPQDLVTIRESRSFCDFNGRHNADTHRQTEYNCIDYRGADGLWRVIFGPGSVPGTRFARKVFKKDHGDWIFLAEFDNEARLVSESPSGTKVRIALGGGQNEAPQANGDENPSPLQSVIPPELKKLLPGLGTLLGK